MTVPPHTRSDIIGPDGLSRLTLGQAVHGELEKGGEIISPPGLAAVAAEVERLYDPRWLHRELSKPRAAHATFARRVLNLLRAREWQTTVGLTPQPARPGYCHGFLNLGPRWVGIVRCSHRASVGLYCRKHLRQAGALQEAA